MQDFSAIMIDNMAIHLVGNKIKDEELRISSETSDILDEVTLQYLKQFFFSAFKFDLTYRFSHETDISLNEIHNYTQQIFNNENSFLEQSANIAKHLYEVSVHPNIKSGELYVVYFKNCILNNKIMDAIGIFKSETKDFYLELNDCDSKFNIYCKQGINTKKLDKGCLILNENFNSYNKVYIVDSNANDALYWKKNFLNVVEDSNEFYNTSTILKSCKQFIRSANDIEPKEKLSLINNSIQYFESHEKFELNDFTNTIFNEDDSEKFKNYLEHFPKKEIAKNFPISSKAVSNLKRTIKNFIKLDSNIEIKINPNIQKVENIIEKGFDKEKNMKYYKIYYVEEK